MHHYQHEVIAAVKDELKEVAKEYAKQYPRISDKNTRKQKGAKIAAVLEDVLSAHAPDIVLDIGASGCIPLEEVSRRIKPKLTIGVDLDAHVLPRPNKNVSPMVADAICLPFSDASLDVVICNHVYEHVSDSTKLMKELFRILKPGGMVYLGAMNARWPMEPHYDIPFLHWMPVSLAEKLVRAKGYNHGYLERPLTTPKLDDMVSAFEVIDYTVAVVSDPERYCATDVVQDSWLSGSLRGAISKLFYGFLPSYIWILKKPGGGGLCS